MDYSIFNFLKGDDARTPEQRDNPYPNGPREYKRFTNGQVRRQRAREIRRGRRKQARQAHAAYLQQRLLNAFIRGHVEAATRRNNLASEKALIERYGFANLDEAIAYVEGAVEQR